MRAGVANKILLPSDEMADLTVVFSPSNKADLGAIWLYDEQSQHVGICCCEEVA